MIINSITTKDYKHLGSQTFNFKKLNLIKADNGGGKTSLVLSPLFVLQGYTGDQTLQDLPTRGKSKSCSVSIELDHSGLNYIVTRSYPTKIEVLKDGKQVDFGNNNITAQNYLNDIFGNIEYFRKFRIVDNTFGKKGSNFLEEGKVSLNKILLSLSQDVFNNIRQRLNEKKSEREKFNIDRITAYKHFPSPKRLEVLKNALNECSKNLSEIDKDIRSIEQGGWDNLTLKGKKESFIEYQQSLIDKMNKYSVCPTCKQNITMQHKEKVISEAKKTIAQVNEELKTVIKEIDEDKELRDMVSSRKDDVYKQREKINQLKLKLENRIAQKDYIYSEKDVLLVKNAIAELDKFYAYYITQWVKILEPTINSVIEKINYKLEFKLNEKGQFDIKIYEGNQEWAYTDLSCGERTILSIAFKMALLLEQNEEGLIIADEGFSSLSQKNLEHIFKLFDELPFQLIAVVHRLDESILPGMNVIDLDRKETEVIEKSDSIRRGDEPKATDKPKSLGKNKRKSRALVT